MSWIIPFAYAKPTPPERQFNRWMYAHPWRFSIEALRFAIYEAVMREGSPGLGKAIAGFRRRVSKEEQS